MHEDDHRGKARPSLLFYCQHSLGIGHLTRSFALARALAARFQVVFLNGGRLPAGLPVPDGIEVIDLPALGMDDGHTVVSRDAIQDVGQVWARRRLLIEGAVDAHRPAVVLIELFPFGRKKFAGEILSLIRRARRMPGAPALVACSLRDILVDARPDQQHHDDRARWLCDRYIDLVLVHADPAFARLEDSFRPRTALSTPVHYTGFVVSQRAPAAHPHRQPGVLVSAGGGIVGMPLFEAALQARTLLDPALPMQLIAGPFLPEHQWQSLRQRVRSIGGVELLRQVADMAAMMRQRQCSVSQCGYNTALDIVVSEVPALVVPYQTATENEQSERARRLAAMGALMHLPGDPIDPRRLARAIGALAGFVPGKQALRLDGATRSVALLERALWQRRAGMAQGAIA